MSTFPTTSTHILETKPRYYDMKQFASAIKAAQKKKVETVSGSLDQAPDARPLFHLHTLTLDMTLKPPEEHLEYGFAGRRREEENPEYTAFAAIRNGLCTSLDPMVPLPLVSAQRGLLRDAGAAPTHARYWGAPPHINVFLPTGHAKKPLLGISDLPNALAKEWMPNSSARDLQHWLNAVISLDPDQPPMRKGAYRDDKRRFYLDSDMSILWVPGDGDEIDLKILITINCRVDMKTLYEPLPEIGHDLLGLILHSTLPSPTATNHVSESEARATALRHFFACLRPAPDHPITFNAKSLQPKEMVSKLLPFQARTLALLLKREGVHIAGDEKPQKHAIDPLGFWEGWNLGGEVGKVAYRRITGEFTPLKSVVSTQVDRKGKGKAVEEEEERIDGLWRKDRDMLPILLDMSDVRGTMLCEEMGLGKTVEAIALVLLHRHPLSTPRGLLPKGAISAFASREASEAPSIRKEEAVPIINLLKGAPDLDKEDIKSWVEAEKTAFSGVTAWDESSQLNVTEVATTLIVSPPVLLKQWVSEVRYHSPHLRVCVYEGWKSLQRGIEKQHDASLRAYKARLEDKKRKASLSFRNKTVKKYTKLNRGKKESIKVESGSESEGDEEEPVEEEIREESSLEICQRQFVDYVRAHDIVVTTYQDLSADLKVALPAPSRARRSNANYRMGERPRSPLVMVEWWRVIMDEVQLHGDQSDAAEMVSLIPRRNSLAVSGTPARSDIKDLMGSLKFLRVPVLPFNGHLWHRLQQPSMRRAFEGIFREIAVRTTKKEVNGEFHLPSQSRFVVPIELSEIELHYYNDTLDRQREILHLSPDGRPRSSDWVLDRSLFRACLMTLRQICTHIQVGQMQAGHRGERLHLGRELMTMSEALDKMRNDHSADFLLETRAQLRKMIEKAQLLILDTDNPARHRSALALYEKVRERVTKQLGPVRQHLQKLLEGEDDSADEGDIAPAPQLTQKEKEKATAITSARQSIREMLIIQHQAWFFEGDVHHVEKDEDREIDCYTRADELRKEILARPLKIANTSVERLGQALQRSRAIEEVSELQTNDIDMRGGFLSTNTLSQANELLKILNGNAELVFHWREKIIQLLSSPIDSEAAAVPNPGQGTEVENPEEEFYAEALKAQGDVEAYLIAYAALVADRREFLNEERSTLTELDGRMTKQRTTRRAEQARVEATIVDALGDVAEQAARLMTERQAFREAREHQECTRPLKALLFDLNPIMHGSDRPEEVAIAKRHGAKIKTYLGTQTEYVDKLLKELELFRATFNQRVIYFAALQDISDSVTAPEFRDLQKDIESCTAEINELEVKLTRMVIKGRFLQYLGTKENGEEELREDCIICMGSSDDHQAVLLECGHFFCISCFREFRRSVQGRKCPSCRTEINDRGMTKIKLTGADDQAEEKAMLESIQTEEGTSGEAPDASQAGVSPDELERQRREADLEKLKMLDVSRRREVANMDMMGEYGSKINFLIKHLLWYRMREPDARHVIFSNWSDSLNIVIRALLLNGIKFVSFDHGGRKKDIVEKFVNDKTISVFLLHAERESSGLTLTSCRVVHLLEPVLRHSFELQAIGRVDRLGQDKETTVYCYATMETVESRILSQGVRNGTSIYLKDENADSVVASMPNVVSAAHKGGDLTNDGNEEQLLSLIM